MTYTTNRVSPYNTLPYTGLRTKNTLWNPALNSRQSWAAVQSLYQESPKKSSFSFKSLLKKAFIVAAALFAAKIAANKLGFFSKQAEE